MMRLKRKLVHLVAVAGFSAVAVLGFAPPAAAAPVGSCSTGPSWDNGIKSGVATCNGSFWRLNVSCLNNSTMYGPWGGSRTAVTRHSGCHNNWFVNVFTQ